MKHSLGSLVNAIDLQVRTAAIDAQHSTAVAIHQQAPVPGLPPGATMPRDMLAPTRIILKTRLYVSDEGATFHRCRGGAQTELKMEWKATAVPEALALVRTKAETLVAAQE